MPMTVPGQANQASNMNQANYVCNEWGHCWHRHYDSDSATFIRIIMAPGTRWVSGGWHHWHRIRRRLGYGGQRIIGTEL